MSVKPVEFYLVECDEDGCDVDTGSLGDYAAWGDRGGALDDWYCADGISLADGRTFCERHGDQYRCTECREPSDALVVGEDDVRRCSHCHKEILAEQGGES